MSTTFIKSVKNYMDGNSYQNNPLTTLKLIAASSIFGEPKYYIGNNSTKIKNLVAFLANPMLMFINDAGLKTVEDIMEKAIDEALNYDFAGTIEYAKRLRSEFNMRLNPQIIFVRAAIHPKRVEFNEKHPRLMRELANAIISRPDDMTSQLEYFIGVNGSKHHLPNIMKRVWTEKLASLSAYQVAKYKSKGLIDLTRLANTRRVRMTNKAINTLMEKGTIEVTEEDQTWEKLSSEGKSWTEILKTIKVPHMALLRNLRNIEQKVTDVQLLDNIAQWLVAGVANGKQFPFRYYTALNNVTSDRFKKALESCVNEAMKNFPRLEGKTLCLTDNSGSAHGAFTSEYGSVTVAEIGNLSSVMTAINSDEGYVGIFGDRLEVVKIEGGDVFKNLKTVNSKGRNIGGSTENGIWIAFNNAIKNKEYWDNIFVFSDQQCGHGGLYGTNPSEYKEHCVNGRYVDVLSLVNKYRAEVNKDVNVFSVQTAGYDNSVLPELNYRTGLLTGWTGKECVFAKHLIDIWNGKV